MNDSDKRIALLGEIADRLMANTHITDAKLAAEIARRWVRSS